MAQLFLSPRKITERRVHYPAFWHWSDRQSWDQAVMVARHQKLDYEELIAYAKDEGADPGDIDRLFDQAVG